MSHPSALTLAAAERPHPRSKEYLPIGTAILLWGLATPLIKYLEAKGCDPYSMTFYRSACASLCLLLWACRARRQELLQAVAAPGIYLILGLLFGGGLICYILGIYLSSATQGALLTRAIPLLVVLFSAIVYPDERSLIRRRDFLLGFGLAALGLAGLALVQGRSGNWSFSPGTGLLALSVLIWSTHSLLVKRCLQGRDPFVVTGLMQGVTAILAFPLMLWLGNGSWILSGEPVAVGLLFASGPLIMGLAEGLYYVTIARLGLGLAAMSTLAIPLVTALAAWPLVGEIPGLRVLSSGALLLCGLALVIRARGRLLPGLPPD